MTNHTPLRVNQMNLVSAILAELMRQGGKDLTLCPRQYNAVIEAANLVCEEVAKPFVESRPGTGVYAWLASDDVGESSKFMASRVLGVECPEKLRGVRYAHPHDADDFGRCYRMLAALLPSDYEILYVSSTSAQWSALVRRWEELSRLYEAGDHAGLDREVRRILKDLD